MDKQQIEIIHTNLTPEQTKKEHDARLLAATASHRRDTAAAKHLEVSFKEFKEASLHRKVTKVYMLSEICLWITVILYITLNS